MPNELENGIPQPQITPRDLAAKMTAFHNELTEAAKDYAKLDVVRGDGAFGMDIHKEAMMEINRHFPAEDRDGGVFMASCMSVVFGAYSEAIDGPRYSPRH